MAKIVVLKSNPETIFDDYSKLMHLADYKSSLSSENDLIIKLNLSWTKFFPSCSSPPWQLEGILKTLINDGFNKEKLYPVENKTVVTDTYKGAKNNKWDVVLRKYGLKFYSLPEVEWIKYVPKTNLLKLCDIFPEGIEIPKMFVGKDVLHLPTVKTHGHSITTGAIKNSFGGLLKEVRHYCHKYIHEVLVDLVLLQQEIHPNIFAVMDGTICGDGAGPRTIIPKVKNILLASNDSVAIDAVAAKIMGFEPLEIPYIKMCHEMGLGVGDIKEIDIIGEDISEMNFNFRVKRSLVIWGDQLLRKGFLRFLEKPLLHSPLVVWAPFASNVYHEWFWYPIIGKRRIKEFMKTEWSVLFNGY